MPLQETITKTLQTLENISETVNTFQNSANVHCIKNCGSCCLSNNVTASILEMLPIANSLIQSNQETHYLKILPSRHNSPCTFFHTTKFCTVYNLRPSICRLFPFATTRNKFNQPQLPLCKLIKLRNPSNHTPLLQFLPPSYIQESNKLDSINPNLSYQKYNINTATLQSIQLILTHNSYKNNT